MKNRNPYQSRHNFETGARVETALKLAGKTRFAHLSAVAFYGIVELCGEVSNAFDKALAMRLAKSVSGVSTVVESIRVRSNSVVKRPALIRRRRQVHMPLRASNDRLLARSRPDHRFGGFSRNSVDERN